MKSWNEIVKKTQEFLKKDVCKPYLNERLTGTWEDMDKPKSAKKRWS